MGLLTTGIAFAVGAGGAVAAAPLVLAGVGFTAGGVAVGSYAAGWMSSIAIGNGGAVAAGSLFSLLQSAGVLGLSGTATAAVGAGGGTVAAVAAVLI